MKRKGSDEEVLSELRSRAEAKLGKIFRSEAEFLAKDPITLLHELKVHQIELEMQNEELRRSQEDLEALKERYRELYDFAPTGYLTLDEKFLVTSANRAASALLAVEKRYLVGQPMVRHIHGASLGTFQDYARSLLAGEEVKRCEVRLLADGGLPRWIIMDGEVTAGGRSLRIILTDITERKKLEEEEVHLNQELQTKAEMLDAANVELDAFNHAVAHDLKNLLNPIGCYCQLVKDACESGKIDDCAEYADVAYNIVQRMASFIDAMLKFSRYGHDELKRVDVDLSRLALEIVHEHKLNDRMRAINLQIAEGVRANGDKVLLRVVLANLLGNAFKYTSKKKEAVIGFGVMERDGERTYFVSDNGNGFNMEYADKLFIPFQRLPGSDQYKGHGLGLATVERIIKRHGGKVWAESKPREGATFYFTL